MAVPSISDLKTYIGTLINNTYWNYNFTKLVSWLTDSTADLTFQSFNVNANSSMGNAKITNLGDPTSSTDAANKGYVDNSATPLNYIAGYTISNNSVTPNTQIDISAGICQDSTNSQVITNSISVTKKLDAAWASGTAAGMLDTGSISSDTWYHIFAISKNDGTNDILASTSLTNPALPTGYTRYRRIGSIKTDGSTHIILFKQKGNYFIWDTSFRDIDAGSSGTITQTALTITAPPLTRAILRPYIYNSGGLTGINIIDKNTTDSIISIGGNQIANNYAEVYVNSSSQIDYSTESNATNYSITNIGYIDNRGFN